MIFCSREAVEVWIMSMSGARVLAMSGYVWVNVLPDDGNAGLPRLGQ